MAGKSGESKLWLKGPAGLQLKPGSGSKAKLSKPKALSKPSSGSVFGADDGDSLDDDASERARVSQELRLGVGPR